MRFSANLRRLIAWLAIGSLLFGSVGPTLVQATTRSGSDGTAIWHEICTSSGFTRVSGTDATKQHIPAHPALLKFGHCPLCTFNHPVLGLAPGATQLVVLSRSVAEVLPRATASLQFIDANWTAVQPRAPPFIS